MRVHLCQMDIAWHDRPANHAAALAMIEQAGVAPGDLVVLPEMFAVGFSMDVAATHDADGRTERFVRETARRLGIYLIAGNVTKETTGPAPHGRNEALVVAPDGTLLARFHKLHPFRFAGEHEAFRAGDHIDVIDWTHGTESTKVAPFVCYDLRFPEAFRLAVKRGAEVMVVIANWPTPRVAHWLALLTARAIENQAYVVGVNRAGHDPKHSYPGRSVVVDPQGRTVLDLGGPPAVAATTPDLAELRAYRARFPALGDMRLL